MERAVLHSAVGRVADCVLGEEGFRRLLLGLVKRGEAGYYMRERQEIDGESHTPLTLALKNNLEDICVALMVHTRTDCTIPSINIDTKEETTPLQWAEKVGAESRVVKWIERGILEAEDIKKTLAAYPKPDDHDEWVSALDLIRVEYGYGGDLIEVPAEIIPGLYLTSADQLGDMRGMTAIVNCCATMMNSEIKGIPYLPVNCDDSIGYPILKHTDEVALFINEHLVDDSKVVIHCWGGINRSTALLLCYLMQHKGLTLTDAFRKTYSRRPIVLSNKSFVTQVISFAHKLGKLQ